jgi:hypothetical protein
MLLNLPGKNRKLLGGIILATIVLSASASSVLAQAPVPAWDAAGQIETLLFEAQMALQQGDRAAARAQLDAAAGNFDRHLKPVLKVDAPEIDALIQLAFRTSV